MNTRSLVILLFFLFLGCTPHFFSSRQTMPMDPETLFRKLWTPQNTLHTFQAKGIWTFHTDAGTFRGLLQVRAKLPDSIWVKIEGPLGIDLFTFRIAQRLVTAYSPWMGEPILDMPDSLWFGTFPLFELHFSPTPLLFLGQMTPNGDSLVSFFKKGKFYVASFSNHETWWIDPRGPVISKWEKRDESGKPIFWYQAQRFKSSGAHRIPRMMQWGSNEKNTFSLFYEEIHTNATFKPGWCHVKIPSSKDE